MKTILRKIELAHKKYISVLDVVEMQLADKINCDFFILYQESDGFVVVIEEMNLPLNLVIEFIEKNKKLDIQDAELLAI